MSDILTNEERRAGAAFDGPITRLPRGKSAWEVVWCPKNQKLVRRDGTAGPKFNFRSRVKKRPRAVNPTVQPGKPKHLTPDEIEQVRRLDAAGWSRRRIAAEIGRSIGGVRSALDRIRRGTL